MRHTVTNKPKTKTFPGLYKFHKGEELIIIIALTDRPDHCIEGTVLVSTNPAFKVGEVYNNFNYDNFHMLEEDLTLSND
jgi:hypothetical protein